MFGTYEQEHMRYRVGSIYETARQVRDARIARESQEPVERRSPFWQRVTQSFRPTARTA